MPRSVAYNDNDSTDDLVMSLKEFYVSSDNASLASTVSTASNSTIKQIRRYIQSEMEDAHDDASTILTRIIDRREDRHKDNIREQFREHLREDDDESTASSASRGIRSLLSKVSRKSRSNISLPKSRKPSRDVSPSQSENTFRRANRMPDAPSEKDMDSALDQILSNKKNEKSEEKPSSAEFESKLNSIAVLIDKERQSNEKLGEIEKVLQGKKAKIKSDIEIARWESKVQKMESLLEAKRKEKKMKLLQLANALEELKLEKREMKKYVSKSKPKSKPSSKYSSSIYRHTDSSSYKPSNILGDDLSKRRRSSRSRRTVERVR